MFRTSTQSDFEQTRPTRTLEDYPVGHTLEFRSVRVTQDEIVAFARRFDRQYFHTDPDRAATGPFGGLVASGFHTTAIMMRTLTDEYFPAGGSLGTPGVDELRWLQPVRAGTTLRLRVAVLDASPSKSVPGRGLLRTLAELVDCRTGDPVLRCIVLAFIPTRTHGGRSNARDVAGPTVAPARAPEASPSGGPGRLLTPAEVASLFHVDARTVMRWA